MTIQVSPQTEAWLVEEARRLGISVDALVTRLIDEAAPSRRPPAATRELPVWHLGDVGSLHKRDIYDDVR